MNSIFKLKNFLSFFLKKKNKERETVQQIFIPNELGVAKSLECLHSLFINSGIEPPLHLGRTSTARHREMMKLTNQV